MTTPISPDLNDDILIRDNSKTPKDIRRLNTAIAALTECVDILAASQNNLMKQQTELVELVAQVVDHLNNKGEK